MVLRVAERRIRAALGKSEAGKTEQQKRISLEAKVKTFLQKKLLFSDKILHHKASVCCSFAQIQVFQK